jgi:hypothetical protein
MAVYRKKESVASVRYLQMKRQQRQLEHKVARLALISYGIYCGRCMGSYSVKYLEAGRTHLSHCCATRHHAGALLSGRKRGINVLFQRGTITVISRLTGNIIPFVKLSNLLCEVPRRIVILKCIIYEKLYHFEHL